MLSANASLSADPGKLDAMPETPEKRGNATPYPKGAAFHKLLDWHLDSGTRGDASPDHPGAPWSNPEFERALDGVVYVAKNEAKNVRNWRAGRVLPDLGPIEKALFAVKKGGKFTFNKAYHEWRMELRAAHKAVRDFGAAQTPPPIDLPTTHFLGRDEDINTILNALLAPEEPQCVLVQGPPGIGKTQITKKIAHHDRVIHRFGEDRRWFVKLETAKTAETMRSLIIEALRSDPKLGFAHALALLETRPGLIVLDNLETPWEPLEERDETEATMARLAAIPGVALLASFRGRDNVGGAGWEVHPVDRLPAPLDAQLFQRVAKRNFATDPCLPLFLKALAGVPLAIELVARRAHGRPSLGGLWKLWQDVGTKAAEHPDRDAAHPNKKPARLTSLNHSIELSLASERLARRPAAERLFRWLGQVPAGLAEEDRDHLLAGEDAYGAQELLANLGLIVERGERADMLSPIREYARRQRAPEGEDAEGWVLRYLELLETQAPKRDTHDGREAAQRLTPEFANIAAAIDALDTRVPEGARFASWALTELGDVFLWLGRSSEALRSYRAGLALYEAQSKADPGNAGWRRDLAVSYSNIGDVLVAQGNLPEALKNFRAALDIADQLAKADPGNAGWRRDLSVSYNKIGDVLVAQGNLPDALNSFRAALDIADQLAKADPGNAGWCRDLSVSYERVGDVLVAQGKLPEALKSFRDGLDIANQLAKADPGNAGWRRDLSVSHNKIGDVLVAQGNLPEALKSYRADLEIADQLAKADTGNAEWRHDLSVSHIKIGDVLLAQGNLHDALKSFRAGLEIADQLAKADPGNAGWRRDLSVSYNKIGDVLVAQGNLPEALNSFRAGLDMRDQLAKADPGNAEWRRDLSVSHNKIGNVLVAQGNLPEALKSARAALDIADQLAKADPGNAEWQRDLLISCVRIAACAPDEAAAALARALDVARSLHSAGRLAPRDHWMVAELERRLLAAETPRSA